MLRGGVGCGARAMRGRRCRGAHALVVGVAAVCGALLMAPPPQAGAAGPGPSAARAFADRDVARPLVYPGGGIYSYGDAQIGSPKAGTIGVHGELNSPIVAMVATSTGSGYWLAGADGGVYALGSARFYGSLGATHLQGPIVAMAATPDDQGYWLAAIDGGVFAFGNAGYYGSMGGKRLAEPIVGMATTPTGGGYWLVAADGGVFCFGNAKFFGSMGGHPLDAPIAGMAVTPDGKGYWEVAADGGIFTFGNAKFFGSMGGEPIDASIVSMASMPTGKGYWLTAWDGGVFTFGNAKYYGSPTTGDAAAPVTQIVPTPTGGGYWLLEPDAFDYSFANPPPNGTFPGSAQIVAAAESQVQPDPDTGVFCNPYGPCEEWCALFASWAWQRGGVPIPQYAFTGDIYDWAAQYGVVMPGSSTPMPGDAILYGTGPTTTQTSLHTGIVAQVWPDGAIVTIEGDAGPGMTGHYAVIVNGPFLPADSDWYNGFGIYAFAQP